MNCEGWCLQKCRVRNIFYRAISCWCQPVSCPNFLVCGNYEPKYQMDIYGICAMCYTMVGRKLSFVGVGCDYCRDPGTSTYLACGHWICRVCYYRCFYDPDMPYETPEPQILNLQEYKDWLTNYRYPKMRMAAVPWFDKCPVCGIKRRTLPDLIVC